MIHLRHGNPEGSIFNNALVRTKRNPQRFVTDVVVPYAHPNAENIKIISVKNLPSLSSIYQASIPAKVKYLTNMTYAASMVSFNYEENGKRYSERVVSITEDFGSGGGFHFFSWVRWVLVLYSQLIRVR